MITAVIEDETRTIELRPVQEIEDGIKDLLEDGYRLEGDQGEEDPGTP
jgi:hypothetical protein